MINRDDIEAGDKVYTRDGGCLVARSIGEGLLLGGVDIDGWELDGQYSSFHDHPLDIIRIEKAPKPVVREFGIGINYSDSCYVHAWPMETACYDIAIKLTIINGKLDKAEQVK